MQQNYAFVMEKNVLPSEGGYCWDVGDPGGPTKYGITCYDLAEFQGVKMDSMKRWAPIVQAMSLDTAMQIYDKKYAVKCRFNDLAAGLDYTVIDYGINSGVARPPRVLSALLGLSARSTMDDALMSSIAKVDTKELIHSVNKERLHFMHGIRGGDAWARFGKGWQARVDHVDATSIGLFEKAAPVIPAVRPEEAQGKAQHVPDPKVQSNITKGTAGGTIATQAGHGTFPVTYVVVAGVIVVVTGIVAYQLYKRRILQKNLEVILPPGVRPLLSSSSVQAAFPGSKP